MAESNCVFTYKADPQIKDFVLHLRIKMNACFDKNTSWVMENQRKDQLLSHEQLHFDICELHIRNLKKNIVADVTDPMEYDTRIKELFSKAWDAYMDEQEQYDNETEHGILKDKQLEWEKKVKERLLTSGD
jgi:predicted secreted Zn-dependent protease